MFEIVSMFYVKYFIDINKKDRENFDFYDFNVWEIYNNKSWEELFFFR